MLLLGVHKPPRTTEEWNDITSRDHALLALAEQNIILDATESEDLDTPHPIRSISSNLVATQLNYISKTYRFESNEFVRLYNISCTRNKFENSEEYVGVCKKIDQHFEKQPHSLYIDSEIITFASMNQDYESLSREAKMRLNLARIEILHLELQMERHNLLEAKTKVADNKVREIVCGICMEDLHPSVAVVALYCGHVFCATCLVKDSSQSCALCTTPKNRLEFVDLYLRYNLDYRPICRFCLKPFTDEIEISFLKCGHAYCNDCVHKLDGICFCGRFLNVYNLCNTLHPRFN